MPERVPNRRLTAKRNQDGLDLASRGDGARDSALDISHRSLPVFRLMCQDKRRSRNIRGFRRPPQNLTARTLRFGVTLRKDRVFLERDPQIDSVKEGIGQVVESCFGLGVCVFCRGISERGIVVDPPSIPFALCPEMRWLCNDRRRGFPGFHRQRFELVADQLVISLDGRSQIVAERL